MISHAIIVLFLAFTSSTFKVCIANNLVKTYRCTSDADAVQNSPMNPSESRLLRVCVEGIDNAATCEGIIEATIEQASNNISDAIVIAGVEQTTFKGMENTVKGRACMVAITLKESYFTQPYSSVSLGVVLSGSVSMTSMEGNTPFSIAVDLTCSDSKCQSIETFQCTSDYKLYEPDTVTQEEDFVRLCIKGTNAADKCQKVVEATLTQATNNIVDKLIVGGKSLFENKMEITYENGVCLIAIMDLDDKYFVQSSSDSLQVEISGEVSVSMADGTDGNLRKAEEAANLRFAHTIKLTAGDGDSQHRQGNVAQSFKGLATGLVVVVAAVL